MMSLIKTPVTVTYRVDKIKISNIDTECKVHLIKSIHRMITLTTSLECAPKAKHLAPNNFEYYLEQVITDIAAWAPFKGISGRDYHRSYYQLFLN